MVALTSAGVGRDGEKSVDHPAELLDARSGEANERDRGSHRNGDNGVLGQPPLLSGDIADNNRELSVGQHLMNTPHGTHLIHIEQDMLGIEDESAVELGDNRSFHMNVLGEG